MKGDLPTKDTLKVNIKNEPPFVHFFRGGCLADVRTDF